LETRCLLLTLALLFFFLGRKLFGVWYSGLEYDYRGLAYLYEETSKKRIS